MKTLSIRTSIKRGWILFKGHKKTLIASLLVLMILQSVSNNNFTYERGNFGHPSFLMMLAAILAWIAITVVKIGWLKITLLIEEGKSPKWTDIFAYGDYFVKFAIANILYILGIALFTLLLIIPGIYFAITYSFVPLLVIDTDLTIGECFTRSAEMTKGHKWKLIGLMLAIILIIILGAMALVIGLLVAIPVSALAYAHAYKTLSKTEVQASNPEAPEMAL